MNIDITKYKKTLRVLNLWEVPRNSVVSFYEIDKSEDENPWLFHHLDGMYSYCTVLVGKHANEVFHAFAGSQVYIWEEV